LKTVAKLIAAGAKLDVQETVREGGRACSSCCSSMRVPVLVVSRVRVGPKKV